MPKSLDKRLEELEIKGRIDSIQTTVFYHNGQYTEKGPGDLGRLDVTETAVVDYLKNSQGANWISPNSSTKQAIVGEIY